VVNELRLKVAASSIDGKGVAKLDIDTFDKMKLNEGSTVTLTYGAKSIELIAKRDNVYSEATARLMKTDMAVLRVEEGTLITIVKKSGSNEKDTHKFTKKGRKKANAASLDSF
jgi:hypothetical protein